MSYSFHRNTLSFNLAPWVVDKVDRLRGKVTGTDLRRLLERILLQNRCDDAGDSKNMRAEYPETKRINTQEYKNFVSRNLGEALSVFELSTRLNQACGLSEKRNNADSIISISDDYEIKLLYTACAFSILNSYHLTRSPFFREY